MTAGRMAYFTSAYINIRVIRDLHKSALPIEVFYAGVDEISQPIVDYMHKAFRDVTFIDIYKVRDIPDGVPMNGFQIKVFSILFSSFEEVLWLDCDDMPFMKPDLAFELQAYKDTGALYWPDTCVIHTAKLAAWDVFGLKRPDVWPNFQGILHWPNHCDAREPKELETGQLVMHKRRAWRGLMMTAFINRHGYFFMSDIIHGDKQTFSFGFNATETAYSLVRYHPFGLGRGTHLANGELFFCSNSYGQRHPVTGEVMV